MNAVAAARGPTGRRDPSVLGGSRGEVDGGCRPAPPQGRLFALVLALALVIVACGSTVSSRGVVGSAVADSMTRLELSSRAAADAARGAFEPKVEPPTDLLLGAATQELERAIERAYRAALAVDGVSCLAWLRAQDGVTFEVVEDFVPGRPRRGRGRCTIDQPVRLGARVGDVVFDRDDMLMSCELARAMVEMAEMLRERGIVAVENGTPYDCRPIGRRRVLSQHGHGAALDIASFTGADKRVYDVEAHWEHDTDEPVTPEGAMLYKIVHALYDDEIFNIILTPNRDAEHDRWLHMDLTPGQHLID